VPGLEHCVVGEVLVSALVVVLPADEPVVSQDTVVVIPARSVVTVGWSNTQVL
jgi:hypothetical protein